MAEPTTTTMPRPATERRQPPAPEFPGCRPMRIPRDRIADCDIRFEYWDADTEIAMVCEPVSYYHERPASRLARLADRIAAARGERQRIMQADQILFLRPLQTMPQGKVIEVGADSLPDVVLEVDNTTDVRRGKLGLYESWGFPEVWVEVPDEPDESRPASVRPGLTIHLREAGRLRPALVSRSFPGWTADETHRALNEPELSAETTAALRRVGRSLGATEGAGPDDDPFLREKRRESHAAGWSQGRTEAQRANALKVLKARGVSVSASLAERMAQMEGAGERLVDAALACRDEEEFLRLVSART